MLHIMLYHLCINVCNKVYKVWRRAQQGTLSMLDNHLASDDIWSLFSTNWLTDKVC